MKSTHELMERIYVNASSATDIPPIVLLVEDHLDTLDMYDANLSGCGYWVARAVNGLEALEYAQDLHPDAIVTDVGLPGDMDGTDLIRELHADQKLRDVPVVVVTGRDTRDLPSFAGLVVSGLLLKPVSPETLVGTIERILNSRSPSTDNGPSSATAPTDQSTGGPVAASSKVDKKHRCCPHCGTRLTWVETRRWMGVAYDYYRVCPGGCGLSCFNRDTQTFEHLITG
jgi:two-component system, OmpR family, alkaline phosphatase synthesis response regulator PhoP